MVKKQAETKESKSDLEDSMFVRKKVAKGIWKDNKLVGLEMADGSIFRVDNGELVYSL